MINERPDSHLGALNMLRNAADLRCGERLLIVAEDPKLGYYGDGLAKAVATAAQDLGAKVEVLDVTFHANAADQSAHVLSRMGAFDRTVFLARLGDQMRFHASMPRSAA